MNRATQSERTGSLGSERTLGDVVRSWAQAAPDAPVIAAKNKRDMSYRDLAALMDRIARQLENQGFGPDSRLALVHRGGAEMITTLLGIVNRAIAVPVSDGVPAAEFAGQLETYRIDGVIFDARADTPLREIARAQGCRVIEVRPGQDDDAAGHVMLDLPAPTLSAPATVTRSDDIAFVFATSGTTRAAKLVPLRHRHMVARAESTALLHELTAEDRCFNQNRLFLCSGISNACTALYAGGCVAHPDGKGRFALDAFIDSLRTLRPSWYVASYNFNVGVYNSLRADATAVADHTLRFIRATSGHLDPTIAAGLEKIFGVPVIEAYSSTESGRICGNPLPPRRRKHGSVGPPTLNSEVSIVDDNGRPVPHRGRGEVVVRGPNVFDGYEHNAMAKEAVFFGEWYRTGDMGFFDEDGYLTLVGRINEMINRGGQKIAPVEVDEALLAHPEIADAAAFGVPHPTLGEVVGAAIVLAPNSQLNEQDIFSFLHNRLEPFKWPRTFTFLGRIPRGPSGKIRRYQVAELFQALGPPPHASPDEPSLASGGQATPTEDKLAALWKVLLQKGRIGLDDDFFLVGGDSLAATQLVLSVNDLFQVELALESVFSDARTIRMMAVKIAELEGNAKTGRNPDLPSLTIDDRIPHHRQSGGNGGSDKKKQKSRLSDAEVANLFVLDKGTGLRRMRPGTRVGSVAANSHGYRSPEIPLHKPAGTIRFAFLGDSLTFGSWSANETTWPHHVLETLRRAHDGLSCDYVNAAMPGNGVRHVKIEFRESISKFQPDVVALVPGTGGNCADWARKKIGYCGVHYVASRLGQRSRLMGLIEKNLVIYLRQIKAFSDRGKLKFEPHELRELSKDFQRELHDLVTECQNRGSIVVLLTRESKMQRSQWRLEQIWSAGSRLYFAPYMSIAALLDVKDEFNRVIREIASLTSAVLVDMAGALPATKKYFEDSSHCTPEANRIIGERVGRALIESRHFQRLLIERLGSSRFNQPARAREASER